MSHAALDPRHTLFTGLLHHLARKETAKVREDFFTAALTAVLREDLTFARVMLVTLNAGKAKLYGHTISRATVTVVGRTKVVYRHGGQLRTALPDLVLRLSSPGRSDADRHVAIEVKLGAPDGVTSDGIAQLPKYLRALNVDRVAYVRGHARTVARAVRGHARFLRPADRRDHFLWSDFHALFVAGASRRTAPILHRGMLGLLEHEGLLPEHPLLPHLHAAADPTKRAEARSKFRDYWRETRAAFLQSHPRGEDEGWIIREPKSNGTMWWGIGDRRVWKVGFDPYQAPGALRLWVYVSSAKVARRLAENLADSLVEQNRAWRGVAVRVAESVNDGVLISVPYASLLARLSPRQAKAGGIGRRLRAFCEAALTTAIALAAKP